MRSLALALSLAALLAGCSEPADPADAGEVAAAAAAPMANQTLVDMAFVTAMGEPSFVPVDVPDAGAGATRVWLWFRLDEGAWEGLSVRGLAPECSELSTAQGPTVNLGPDNGSGGSTCLAEPGRHELEWSVEAGVVRGRLTVEAEVPAAGLGA